MRIQTNEVAFDAGTQVRAAIDQALVSDYAAAMTEGAKFPPVILFHDGSQHFLADGFHRFMAAQRLQWREIDAIVHPGTKDDALWFALGANRINGKRLSEGDKRHAIKVALMAWPARNPREIAEQIGCDRSWVTKVKAEDVTQSQPDSRTTGRDGKSYPASRTDKAQASQPTKPSVTQRWSRAREMATEGYSSRQMADELGMTLDGVRNGLRREAIDVPADRVIGKSKHHDANRIVDQMVMDAEHLTADVSLIIFKHLHRDRLGDWVRSLSTSRKKLDAFIRHLVKEQQRHGEAA